MYRRYDSKTEGRLQFRSDQTQFRHSETTWDDKKGGFQSRDKSIPISISARCTMQAPQVRKAATGTSAIKFSGRIDNLKVHIYDVGYGQQADAFVKTTEEIAGYAGRACKQSTDIRAAID